VLVGIALRADFGYLHEVMNPPSQPSDYARPVRELFAGMGVSEEILAEQERMDAILPAWVSQIRKREWALSDKSDWEDEEI
jgi:hypothetical protein